MPEGGLAEAEASARLQAEGFNDLPSAERRTLVHIVGDVLREPMFALLLGAGAVYLVLGDLGEAAILLAFATFSVVITVVQQTRSERVLDALRDIASPRALVIRDGQRRRIPGREVVRGDTIVLLEGDRVPADAVLMATSGLQVDESLLTGESVSVHKTEAVGPLAMARPGGDNTPFVYSGTLVVHGEGVAVVQATGPRSELGRIGQSLRRIASEPPRLQVETRRLVGVFAALGIAASLLVIVVYGMVHGDWLQAVLGGIALGMSMLPEEFPLVLTAFMVMGAWRLSRARVLTRRAAAIETLGAATVLCTDKTGTLTENRMTVAELRTPDRQWRHDSGLPMPQELAPVIEAAMLASAPHPSDPMEKAIAGLAGAPAGAGTNRRLVRSYALGPKLLAMSNVWKLDGAADGSVLTKGAPETVASLCRLGDSELTWLHRTMEEMAGRGERVLGVARARCDGSKLPESQAAFAFEFVGLVGFCLLYTSPSPRDVEESRMPSSA